MKLRVISIIIIAFFFAPFSYAQDVLSPDFYEKDKTLKSYIKEIRNDVREGVQYADEFKKDLGSIKEDQLKVSERSLKNSYEIKLLSLEQGVIKKRVEVLEEHGKETRKLLTLLSKGVEKSLRFVNGVYGFLGFIVGIVGTVTGGVIVIYIKKKLIKKKRLNNG